MTQEPESGTVVFVYGSLKRGYALHHLLASQVWLGRAQTEPRYCLYETGEYPGIVETSRGISVHGEVYRVSAECLRALDAAEGVEDLLYERRPICLQAPHDVLGAQAWYYLGSTAGLRECGASWPGAV